MHTVQFSFYILVWVLVWAPAWSIYGLNTGGKAAILAFSNFNGYSAKRVGLVVSVLEKKRLKTLLQDDHLRLHQGATGWWKRQRAGRKKQKGTWFNCVCYLSITKVNPCDISLIHYPVQYIRGQYCTLPAESTLILHGEDFQCGILSCKSTLIQWWDETMTITHQKLTAVTVWAHWQFCRRYS